MLLLSNPFAHAHPTGEDNSDHNESHLIADEVEGSGALETKIALWQKRFFETGSRRFAIEQLGWLFYREGSARER